MACQTLLRRRAQLELLAGACERGAGAQIRLRRSAAPAAAARLTTLERDGVLLRWTGDRVAEAEAEGEPVEVRFEHKGEHYVFFAVSRGRVKRSCKGAGTQSLLKLGVPLRLERARRREDPRLTLEGITPIEGTFTHVVDERRQFRARLTDVAGGGIGAVAQTQDVCPLYTGDLFWLDIDLPGEKPRSELVVRLVHLRPIKHSDRLALGWAFQPTDDVAGREKCLRRLEAFVARLRAGGSDEQADGGRS